MLGFPLDRGRKPIWPLFALLATAGLVVAGGYYFMKYIKSDVATKDSGITYIISGKISTKRTSCNQEQLLANGSIEKTTAACDAGNSITVSGATIMTGGGALVIPGAQPRYVTDITNVKAGDQVEVKYSDVHGAKSTDCSSCYIKKAGSGSKEPQRSTELSR